MLSSKSAIARTMEWQTVPNAFNNRALVSPPRPPFPRVLDPALTHHVTIVLPLRTSTQTMVRSSLTSRHLNSPVRFTLHLQDFHLMASLFTRSMTCAAPNLILNTISRCGYQDISRSRSFDHWPTFGGPKLDDSDKGANEHNKVD